MEADNHPCTQRRTHACSRVDGHDTVGGGVQVTELARVRLGFPPAMEEHLAAIVRRRNPTLVKSSPCVSHTSNSTASIAIAIYTHTHTLSSAPLLPSRRPKPPCRAKCDRANRTTSVSESAPDAGSSFSMSGGNGARRLGPVR